IGESSKILVIAIAMLAPVALSTAAGVRGVSRERIDAARSLGATRRQVVRHVMLPSALPSILTGLRIALGAGWSTLVAAELVAATRGLGFMIQSAAQFLVTDVVVMGILVIATIAFALEFVIRRVERALVPWAGKD
ncbi:MAG: ABC transporter permease subunit, partial [Mesorhizobium sp.]